MISICLLTYNHAAVIKNSLPVLIQEAAHHMIDDVFVLDNASDDRGIAYIERYFPKLVLHQLSYRHSYASCVNKALQLAQHEFVIVLQPCFFALSINIDTIKKAFQDPLVAGVSFSFMDQDSHQHMSFSPRFKAAIFNFEYQNMACEDSFQDIFSFLPYAFCFKKDLFLLMGGFNDIFSTAFTCHEFSYRLHKRAFKILSSSDLSVRLIKPVQFDRPVLQKDHFLLFWMHNHHFGYWVLHCFFVLMSFLLFFLSYQRAFFSAFLRINHVSLYKRGSYHLIKDKALLLFEKGC